MEKAVKRVEIIQPEDLNYAESPNGYRYKNFEAEVEGSGGTCVIRGTSVLDEFGYVTKFKGQIQFRKKVIQLEPE